MPLYEYRKNATNYVTVSPAIRQELVCGTKAVLDRMLSLIVEKKNSGRPVTVAIDGWYGVDWAGLQAGLCNAVQTRGLSLQIVSTAELCR